MQFSLSRIVVCCSLIAVCLTAMAGAVRYSLGKGSPATHTSSRQGEVTAIVSTERPHKLPADTLYAKASPAVAGVVVPQMEALDPVTLYANSRDAVATILTEDDLGFDAGQGSGFFLPRELVGTRCDYHELTKPSTNGEVLFAYLLTNYHVIRSAADATVRLRDGRSGIIGDIVAEQEDIDLALVVVFFGGLADDKSRDGTPLSTLSIANGPELPVGQKVYAIGSPKGLEASLSGGIVSGKREIADGIWWLQTTAPVSPGSSGGPLLNSSGEVVGVVTAQQCNGQNLNFAVPASQIRAFLKKQYNLRPLWRGTGIRGEELILQR